MADKPIAEGQYDKTQTAQRNADVDTAAIRKTYDEACPEKAYEQFSKEVDPQKLMASGARPEEIAAYNKAMAEKLKDVLPALALEHVMAPGNRDKVFDSNGRVSDSKLAATTNDARNNPLSEAMYRSFGDRYKDLKANESYGGAVTAQQLEAKLAEGRKTAQEKVELNKKQTTDRQDLGQLLTNPKLFGAIAGENGELNRDEVAAFRKKLDAATGIGNPTDADKKFLADAGLTDPKEQDRARKTLDALDKSFDNPANQDDKKGAVLIENSRGNFSNWLKFGMGQGDYMTRESLAKGMGYTNDKGEGDPAKAAAKLPTDVVVPGTKPRADVPSVTDYSTTAQARGDGPYQVAARMVGGEQAKFFKNPAEAQAIMTDVLRQPKIWDKDKQGVPKVTAENRDEIVKAIKEREAKIAKDGNKPENNDLSNWFASRYPKLEKPAAAPVDMSAVQPDTDRKTGRIGRGEGPIKIAENMAAGSPLDAAAKQALRQAIKPGEYDDKQGPLTEKSIEAIRKNVLASNNEQLKAWFAKRYPPKA